MQAQRRRRLGAIARHCCAGAAAAAATLEAVVEEVNGLPATLVKRSGAADDAVGLRVEKLPAALGAEISGVELEQVDWEAPGGRELGERLRGEMHKHGLLIFPGQTTLSPEQNLRLCHAMSGGLTLYPTERGDKADGSHDDIVDKEGQHDVAQMSGLAYYHAGPEEEDDELPRFSSPFAGDGSARPSRDSEGFEWHDDAAGHEEPRPLSMLYCVESPEAGGETLFLNGAAVLEQLEPGMRAVAERLLVHYCQGEHEGQRIEGGDESSPWDPRVRQYGHHASASQTGELAEVTHSHKLVRIHPVTGLKVLSTAASFVRSPAAPLHNYSFAHPFLLAAFRSKSIGVLQQSASVPLLGSLSMSL